MDTTAIGNWAYANRSLLKTRNYVRSPNPPSWQHIRYMENKVEEYRTLFGDDFSLIAIGSREVTNDFYVLPYSAISDLLTAATLTKEKDGRRSWFISILDGRVRVNQKDKRLTIPLGARIPLFRPGDVVQAESGGPTMTVATWNTTSRMYLCGWSENNQPRQWFFAEDALRMCKPPRAGPAE